MKNILTFFKMSPSSFELLLSRVGPSLENKNNVEFVRPDTISAGEKLAVTVR